MSWLAVTCLYGFAVGASATGFTPVTRVANSADPGRVDAASPTPEAGYVEAAAPTKYEAATVAVGAEAADLAASGAPVFLWKETVTRHIPEKNTWEISVQTQTDYQADIDYEPADFESKVKGLTETPSTTISGGGVQTDISGIPLLTFGGGQIPTGHPSRQDEAPEQGRLTTAIAFSTGIPTPDASNEDIATNEDMALQGDAIEATISVYPAPEFTEGIGGTPGMPQYPHPHRASKVGNARVTPRPFSDILMSLAPKFELTSSKRTYAWDINTETASMQNQEVYFPVSDEVGHDIIKASVGISPSPLVKIAGASATLSVGGSPVTYKGHTFTLAPEGIRVGTQTFSMAAIAPAYNTDYQAVLTIDESAVTFIKDAANPTIMTAPGMTAQLGGPALVTGTHQILYNTDGSLVLDGSISVEPTMVPKPGTANPAGGFEADAQGKSPGGLLGINGETNRGPGLSENGGSDDNGAIWSPLVGSAPPNGASSGGGSSSGSRSSGSQNQNVAGSSNQEISSSQEVAGSPSSGSSGSFGTSKVSAVAVASGTSSAKNATASGSKNGTAKSSASGSSAASTVTVDGSWTMAILLVFTFTITLFSL